MHIVLVSRWYPPHTGYGGVAMYCHYLANALTSLGHRVTVIAARWSSDIPAYADDQGVAVHRILSQYPSWPQRLPLVGRYVRPARQLRYSFAVAQKLHALEASDRPDIVEFPDVEAEGFVYLLRRRPCPVVVRCHTPTFVLQRYHRDDEQPYDTGLTGRMERYCIQRADALTAPSVDMARTISTLCGIELHRFAVIPNPLDVDQFERRDGQTSREGADRGLTVLHVGRLQRVKGIEVLARAILQVVAKMPDAKFIFVGGGAGGGEQVLRLLEGQASENVRFVGAVDQSTLIDWYHRADIAVVPTLNYESFSYTCAQALASGVPLLASRIGGIPETVGEAGLLVSPNDVDALAHALLDLARRPDRRRELARSSAQRARSTFDSPLVAQKMQKAYKCFVERKMLQAE
jgi:glycogen synthase